MQLISFRISMILAFLAPIHAPIGSIEGSLEATTTFVLTPGTLTILLIYTRPALISGTFNSNNLLIKPLFNLEIPMH